VSRAARHAAPGEAAGRVALAGPGLAAEVARILAARGLAAEVGRDDPAELVAAIGRGAAAAAWAASEPVDAATALRLALACELAAEAGRPLVALAPPLRGSGRAAIERAVAIAQLRARGAVVVADPDVWLEAIILVAAIGVPRGPRVAVVAPPGSWLERAASALAAESEDAGRRGPSVAADGDDLDPVDAVLVDRGAEAPTRAGMAQVVTVAARAELLEPDDPPMLVGLRSALAAVTACGRAAERIAAGLGPAPREASAELEIDEARVARQLDKMAANDRRLGDHEAKVLLAAYGVPVTRQAVATTPSAAIRVAKKAGYPVEIKPWGPDVATERAGCPVERNVATAADVRRAFLAVLGAAGLPISETEGDGSAVIIRETPPPGREVSAVVQKVGALGWAVIVDVPGAGAPVAAPAPLRVADAALLAAAVTSTRAGEPEPDRIALANALRRVSHLAVDLESRIEKIELGRIVIGARGGRTMVIDAFIELTDE
jgi:hypothetical protein